MYINRTVQPVVEDYIKESSPNKDVLLVVGARQTGKTTLIERVLRREEKLLKINFQEEENLAWQIDQTKNFSEFTELLSLQKNFNPQDSILFIDEAQESKRLGKYVRFMKEQWTNCSVILSGSMMSEFFRDRYPVGRVKEIVLRPLNFEEFLLARQKDNLIELLKSYSPGNELSEIAHNMFLEELELYFLTGGLPEVAADYVEGEKWIERREIIVNGFRKDFALKYGSEKAELVWKAFKSIALYLGSPSKYTHVVSSSESEYKAVPEVISQLEYWHLILNSEQRGSQPEKNLHAKRYMFDIGVAQQFRYDSRPLPLLHSSPSAEVRRAIGGLLENYVATELSFLHNKLFGYRERTYEVDFIVNKNGITLPLEIKASLKNKKTQFSSVQAYCKTYGASLGFCFNLALPIQAISKDGVQLISLPLYFVGQLDRLIGEINADRHL